MHLQEKTLSVRTVYDGPVFKVTSETAEIEDGTSALRDVVHHSGGVCVIPITENNEIYVVKQFRYPFKAVTVEIPAGKVNKGESHFDCGKRELLEETGCTCEEYTYLGSLYPTPAYDTEIIHIYMAKELSRGSQNLDSDEFLDVEKIPLAKAVEMVMNNELPDSKTQIAVLKAARILGI